MADRQRAKRSQRVTVWDVAERAGVSKSTVSKHLTGTPYVAAETARRIEEAVEALGYEPNGLGRGLARGRTGVLAVVVPSVLNPFYTELVCAVEAECAATDSMVLLGTTQHDTNQHILRRLFQRGVDGFLIASAEVEDREIRRLEHNEVPVVLASRHIEGIAADYVIVDSSLGTRAALEHLFGLGHERIVHLAGPGTVAQFRERAQSYRDAMRDHGLAASAEVLEAAEPTWAEGHALGLELLSRPARERPTAAFVANDYMALGLVSGVRQAGGRVPEDLSVVGFDAIGFAGEAHTPLTTVDSRIDELGRRATRMLLDRVEAQFDGSRVPDGPRHEVLAPELIVRASTGPPSAAAVERVGTPELTRVRSGRHGVSEMSEARRSEAH